MRYLTTAEVLELHRRIIEQAGSASGVRDRGALESSLTQPFQTFGGEDLYESFLSKVSGQAYFLIRNHPFVDGNKRIGHAVLEVTMVLNQLELQAPADEQEQVVLAIAEGSMSREDFTAWVNVRADRLGDSTLVNASESLKDFPLIRARMTRARATHIRHLRVDQSYSWRAIAGECDEQWGNDASWEPPTNQLAGMELCESAAEYFDEHFLVKPWN